MTLVRIAALALAGILLALIIWAIRTASFTGSFSAIIADPWGVVALADLYFGFALFAVVIAGLERNRLAATVWIVAMALLGNVISAVWLAINAPRLWRQLRAEPA